MKRKRYQPWRKGPATIIPFPKRWHRAWLVCLVEGADYRGELHGADCEGERLTEAGPHARVIEVLKRPENRRGLPIVPCWRAGKCWS